MSGDADLTCDGFLDGRLRIRQPRVGYRAATDPVLLAAFVPARPGEAVLELGCGAGTAALCLAARVPGLALHGLELQPGYAALARRNAEANGLALTVHEGDLRRPPAGLRALAFDQVLANPPFHPAGVTGAADPGRDAAHREGEAGLGDWIDAGLRRLRPGGRLTLIHRTARLAAILAGIEGRAGAVEILPLAGRAGRPAERVLVRARKGSRAALRLYPPFTLHAGDAHAGDRESYTAAAQRVLRGMAALSPGSPPGDG
ncbi:MAG TPA: methyltransferase [Amaricoccus sp.]|jgi:tRNA1(Val) A37 N6-methylase TrmN6|nr:methyltransferase [Amaricoccus sp.]